MSSHGRKRETAFSIWVLMPWWDEMVGWHHRLYEREFDQAPGVGDGREAWRAAVHGVAKSWTWLSFWTELNWTECHDEGFLMATFKSNYLPKPIPPTTIWGWSFNVWIRSRGHNSVHNTHRIMLSEVYVNLQVVCSWLIIGKMYLESNFKSDSPCQNPSSDRFFSQAPECKI